MTGTELKSLWKQGRSSVGYTSVSSDLNVALMAGQVGFDWMLIDQMHAPRNPETGDRCALHPHHGSITLDESWDQPDFIATVHALVSKAEGKCIRIGVPAQGLGGLENRR